MGMLRDAGIDSGFKTIQVLANNGRIGATITGVRVARTRAVMDIGGWGRESRQP
jgi:hypothetical protein